MDHYNGQGELSKCTALVKVKIEKLFYRNEESLSFKRVMEISKNVLSTLEKDPDEAYSECCKVKKLLAVIQSSDMEVVSQKLVITSQFPNYFMGACNYFSKQVSHLHGGAQLESCKYRKAMFQLFMVMKAETVDTAVVMDASMVMVGLGAMVAGGSCSGRHG